MSEPAIRPARADDSAPVASLIGQLGYDVTPDDVAERLTTMEAEGRLVLIAEIDGEVVGCLSTSAMRVLHRPALVGRISMIVVDGALRGRVIGKALVRAAEDALAEQGCYMIEVTSNLALGDAHRFYQRLGYERTSIRFARQLRADPA